LFRQGRFRRVPIVIGTNRDEGTAFVDRSFPGSLDVLEYERAVRGEFGMGAEAVLRVYPAAAFSTPKDALIRVTGDADFVCEARRLARALYKEGAPVYLYSFEYPVDEVTPGRAFHGLESNLLFGNNFAPPTPYVLTPPDLVVFDAMSTYWRQFMETGDPNPPGRPVQWPQYIAGVYYEPVDASGTDRHFVFADRLGVSSYELPARIPVQLLGRVLLPVGPRRGSGSR
jgi:para-nitrobenzyl esterase